jgi:hypothetical protein
MRLEIIALGLISNFLCLPSIAQGAPIYTLKVSLEVTSKYPGASSPESVLEGCKQGFPVDKDFTSSSRWEVFGSNNKIVGSASAGKISVKVVQQVAPPFHKPDASRTAPCKIFPASVVKK